MKPVYRTQRGAHCFFWVEMLHISFSFLFLFFKPMHIRMLYNGFLVCSIDGKPTVKISFLHLLTTTILQRSEQCFFNILVPTLKNYTTRTFHCKQYSLRTQTFPQSWWWWCECLNRDPYQKYFTSLTLLLTFVYWSSWINYCKSRGLCKR